MYGIGCVRSAGGRLGGTNWAGHRGTGTRLPPWLPGYRVRVIDGNHLSATERRIRELRQSWAAALPGKVLAVYEQELDLVAQVFLTPDGHAQERSLLDDVLESVRSRDLWIADRNFCTFKFLFGLAAARATFVIRQHGQVEGRLLGQRRSRGRTGTGKVYEQAIELEHAGHKQVFRRITVVLDQPTRDGDQEIHLLSNLPERDANAKTIAELYRRRWTIENRFYEVTQTLDCEPNTLGYPKAALFAFCLSLVASNAVALLKASLRAVHNDEAVADMSSHYMALEIRDTYVGMMIALPPRRWIAFRSLGATGWAAVLRQVAQHVKPARYRKARRGPKKPPRHVPSTRMAVMFQPTSCCRNGENDTLEALGLMARASKVTKWPISGDFGDFRSRDEGFGLNFL